MPDTTTETKPNQTSEEDGKNTEGKDEGADTQTAKDSTEDTPKFTQKDQERLVAKIRREEKEKYERAQAEAKRLADEAKAKEAGEHQKLAEQYEGQLKELKPQLESATAEVERYKVTVADILKAELKALPEEVREVSPAIYAEDKSLTNPLDVLAWLPKGKALAEKLNGQSAVKGAKPSPRANGDRPNPDADRLARAQASQAYRD